MCLYQSTVNHERIVFKLVTILNCCYTVYIFYFDSNKCVCLSLESFRLAYSKWTMHDMKGP